MSSVEFTCPKRVYKLGTDGIQRLGACGAKIVKCEVLCFVGEPEPMLQVKTECGNDNPHVLTVAVDDMTYWANKLPAHPQAAEGQPSAASSNA